MLVSVSNNHALFKTFFSEEYDLVQLFRGVRSSTDIANEPVDFMAAGFIKKSTTDIWHIDVPIGISTDEAVPCFINGSYIGANHGHNGAISVTVESHGKSFADIGSLWQDEAGIKFTLVRIINENCLHFISENIGESTERYQFVKKITGKLTYLENGVNTEPIIVANNQAVTDLKRAIRHIKREIIAHKDGKRIPVTSSAECDYAEIIEEYEIINPATVADDLRALRPKKGYDKPQDLGYFGKPMLLYRVTYRIEDDGTILLEFNHKKLMNIHFERWMGVMYQEKLDVYGGGIARFLPDTLPFSTPEGDFDFSKGVMLRGAPFPEKYHIHSEYWSSPEFPPDRIIDYFRDALGHDKLALSCGYLPVYDGEPSIRRSHVTESIHLYRTRKAYPTFMNEDVGDVHGIAYRKYFVPQKNGASLYTVNSDDKTYIYMHFAKSNVLTADFSGKITRIIKSDNITLDITDNRITAESDHGHALFVCE